MTVETIYVNPTLRIRVEIDPDPVNPRTDYKCFGKIAYLQRSHLCLGDLPVTEFGLNEIEHGIKDGTVIGLPVFAYVHSVVVLKAAQTNPFTCRWDSGQSGFAFADLDKVLQEFNATTLTDEVMAQALAVLAAEVDELSKYLGGEVYGYVIERLELDADGDVVGVVELDSCWGFIGDVSYVCQKALAAAKHHEDAVDAR